MLEKSLAQDETYTDAVCLLAEIMGKKQEYDKAIALYVCARNNLWMSMKWL